MKVTKILVTSALVLGLSVTFLSPSKVAAAVVSPIVECPTSTGGEFPEVSNNVYDCDLSVNKQVSVNGGAFVDADSSATAASAYVGDTITWKITVQNTNTELTPRGTAYISDILPAGVSFNSSVASNGEFIGNDGSYFANNWVLPLLRTDGDSLVTALPATLTITTTANAIGLLKNTATLSKYDNGQYDGGAVYKDANSTNDTNDAYVNIQSKPQVLAATTSTPATPAAQETLAETGTQTISTVTLLATFMTSSALIATTLRRRKSSV